MKRDTRLYVEPARIGPDAEGPPLAGGPLRFGALTLARRSGGRVLRDTMSFSDARSLAGALDAMAGLEVALERIEAPRPALAHGLGRAGRPLVMGVVNVTPDSFSDGGLHATADAATAHGKALLAAGADILDVGGESTRPGADPISPETERERILPVIRALADAGGFVSADTRHASTMAAAAAAGARMINDVTALTGDPDSAGVVAELGLPICLMHMLGEPRTMQADPRYDDVALDVFDALLAAVDRAVGAGVDRSRIWVDPGIGFGKTVDHNLELLRRMALFHATGCPVLIGVSRKRFIGALSGEEVAARRAPGSIAAGLAAVTRGAQMLRVHDVAETAQALSVWSAI